MSTPDRAPAAHAVATICRAFTFEAAHRLPNLPPDHKCGRLHGHSYTAEIEVTGRIDPTSGWVRDFADLRSAFRPLEEALDHRLLNEVPGLENPTSENLAMWIWHRICPALPGLSAVRIRETCTSSCTYRGASE
jgi:6-pyruvoyltetrahydropterin/6-carboxytetrahydropterin synthase